MLPVNVNACCGFRGTRSTKEITGKALIVLYTLWGDINSRPILHVDIFVALWFLLCLFMTRIKREPGGFRTGRSPGLSRSCKFY